MGSAAYHVIDGKRCVTIALDIKFISASKEGDVLIGKVKISKKTNSLVFVVAELFEKKCLTKRRPPSLHWGFPSGFGMAKGADSRPHWVC